MVGRDCQSWDIRLAWIIYYQLDKSYQKSTHCAKLTSRTIPWILHRCFKNPLVLHRCPKQNGKFVETCQKFVPLSIKLWRFLDHFLEDFFGGARGLLNCQRPAVAFGNDKSSFRQLPLVELTWRYNYSTLLVECILIKGCKLPLSVCKTQDGLFWFVIMLWKRIRIFFNPRWYY